MKDESVYLRHMLDCIDRIRTYAAGGRDTFLADSMIQDAVVRNLEVIGDAAKQIGEATRQAHPTVPWRQMAGMRDVLAHNYLGVDLHIVWSVVERELGPIAASLTQILSDETR